MNTTTTDTRPLAERITQGLTYLWPTTWAGGSDSHQIDGKNTVWIESEDHGEIARLRTDSGKVTDNVYANAELIAEAFNVTHETGRTPRQLADERAELIAALDNLLASQIDPMGIKAANCCKDAAKLLTLLNS